MVMVMVMAVVVVVVMVMAMMMVMVIVIIIGDGDGDEDGDGDIAHTDGGKILGASYSMGTGKGERGRACVAADRHTRLQQCLMQ
jgi:hypothetical protein